MAEVHCIVTDDTGALITQGTDVDHNEEYYAQVILTFPGTIGRIYTAVGTHEGLMYIADYAIPPPPQRPYWEYDDFWNFGFFQSEGYQTYPDEYEWFGPGPKTERRNDTVRAGSTTASISLTPFCFAQVKYRAVPDLFPTKNHSFWYFHDSHRLEWIVDAGPSGECPFNCQYLNDWVTQGKVSSHYNTAPSLDDVNCAVAWTAPPDPQLCEQTDALLRYGRGWANNTTTYVLDGRPNSNSFTHDAGTTVGFTNITAQPSAPG